MRKSFNRGRGLVASSCRQASHAVAQCLIEGLEARVCLSSAIAAFATQQTFATGTNTSPQAVAVGDINNDGKADIVTANYFGSITAKLGNGDGTFQAGQTFSAGAQAYSVALADVNGDGKLDAVVANLGSPTVSVLLGNGNGTFQAQQTFTTGTGPHSVAVADLNGDGKMDIAVADKTANTVSILLGNGDGTFQNQLTFSTGLGSNPAAVAIGDFNGDGKPDLVVANQGNSANTLGVLIGNGNGTYQTVQLYPLGTSQVHSVTTADVNGDGNTDLVVTDTAVNSVGVLLGNGNGIFQNQVQYAVGNIPEYVTTGDVNGDGKIDVITANYSSNTVSVLLGNGNGTLQTQKTFSTGTRPTSVALADVNGDGSLDIVTSNYSSNNVSVLLGDVQPTVLSISRTTPAGPTVSGPNGSVTYTVTFSKPVTGVDATDFAVATTGGVTETTPVVVSGSGAVYTVTINGINGSGTLGLNVLDDGTIKDGALNPLANPNANFTGPTYTVVSPTQNTINGTGNVDQITLTQDADGAHIDWTMNGTSSGQLAINDPAGLTINGAGSNDVITLNYGAGNKNPLPNKLNLNGIFTLNNLATTGNPLASTTIDLKTSTLFITYPNAGSDPISLIQGYLSNGFNSGGWNGTSAGGAINSSSAAANSLLYAIGYADSADLANPAQLPADTIELRYTAIGDTDLNGTVGLTDLAALLKNYGTGTRWDQGNLAFTTTTGLTDLAALLKHYNNTAASPSATPSATPAMTAAAAVETHPRQTSAPLTISVASPSDQSQPKKAKSKHR